MKKFLSTFLTTVFISSAISSAQDLPTIKTSADFDKLKRLVGDWKGKMKKPTGETIDVSLSYKVISNGSVIIETSIEDETEMISTYKDRFGKLTGTHYCALGNQPMFNLGKSTDSVFDFELDPACGLKEGKHKFVKALKYTNESKSKDVLKMEYVVINEDKSTEKSSATYKRVK
ncbi:hypothetical protein OAF35_06595 [Verrucomicrobiales bacterium]|nr:hypothetical protein [Verrucomicrobiales bacterium]